eukprot:Sspe_Gene.67192::Locus_39673_Transcript_2_2_Confidence_0.667_Length_1534::g.67192::m.67192/K15542/PFS2; polyadenylation factor subunit 2
MILRKSRQYDNAEYQPKRRIGQKAIDPFTMVIADIVNRPFRTKYDYLTVQPHEYHSKDVPHCSVYTESPISSVAPKLLHTIYNIEPRQSANEPRPKRAMFTSLCWTPEGRRVITGNSKGEFTLWHGTSMASEMRSPGHEDTRVTSMQWNTAADFMVSSDERGQVKYWARNMNCLKSFSVAQKETRIREITLAPSGAKFVSATEDGKVRLLDMKTAEVDHELEGHKGDVTTCHWHPTKSLFASGSQDKNVILWDPRSSDRVSSLLGHTGPILRVRWNASDFWLLTCSKDTTIKLFDIRKMKELHTFAGHRKDVLTVSWHPVHQDLFCSGGNDGILAYWVVGQGHIDTRAAEGHDHRSLARWVSVIHKSHGELRNPNPVVDSAWHPLGHMLATASWESKFWTHNKPGAPEEVRGMDLGSYNPNLNPDDPDRPHGWNVWTPNKVMIPPTVLPASMDPEGPREREREREGPRMSG